MITKFEVGKYYRFIGKKADDIWNSEMETVLDGKLRLCVEHSYRDYAGLEGILDGSLLFWGDLNNWEEAFEKYTIAEAIAFIEMLCHTYAENRTDVMEACETFLVTGKVPQDFKPEHRMVYGQINELGITVEYDTLCTTMTWHRFGMNRPTDWRDVDAHMYVGNDGSVDKEKRFTDAIL